MKNNENIVSIIVGLGFILGGLIVAFFDNAAPGWFLAMLGAVGGWLIIYPIGLRYFTINSLIRQGYAADEVRAAFK